ncbi:hypothetical protein RI367_000499 [Sorochytrium milnesiophthora]
MTDLRSKKCAVGGCNVQATSGFDGQGATVCSAHKAEGMISIRAVKCETDGCGVHASFALAGDRRARYCKAHAPATATDVIGDTPNAAQRKDVQPRQHLVKKLQAKRRIAESDHVNLLEQPCSACGLPNVLDINGSCEFCNPDSFQAVRLRKEHLVRDFLTAQGVHVDAHNKAVDGGACGRERPDFIIECPLFTLMIEVDEFQHAQMVNIAQSVGQPVLFLRFNPDAYKAADKQVGRTARLDTLLWWIKHLAGWQPTAFLSVLYLFFDDYDPAVEQVTTILPFDE